MRRRNAVVLVLLVVASLVALVLLYHRGSGEHIDRSSQRGETISESMPKAKTWTKIYTVCEGEGREYIHSELWQDGKKLDQTTPVDLADLGPDHRIKVRIVPPPGLEPKNFSRSSDVLVKEGDSFIGELDCKFRVKFSVLGYDGFRIFDSSKKEVGGCDYGDNSTYNDSSHSTDPTYCQVFLPGPGKYHVVMIDGAGCTRRCRTHSQKFEVTMDHPRVEILAAPP